VRIRPWQVADYPRALEICVAAFTPIHRGFEDALGPEIFARQYHDWKEQYARLLGGFPPADPNTRVFVAEEDGVVLGFVVTSLDPVRGVGEIGLNAVDPARQGSGIGRAMYEYVLEDLKRRGAVVAYVGTGGDRAHARARAAYAAVGFDRAIPALHLFKKL
jgi:ribosomal protein S18 acetylase RimI-like enzyme